MESNQSTTDLLNFLQTIHTKEELETYLQNHTTTDLSFPEYFQIYLQQNELETADVISASGLERHYAYQILNGTKTRPSKNKIIALCIGAHMNLKDTQRCLKLSKNASLYPKDTGDALIITHINNEQWNIVKLNAELWSHNLEPLS